MRSYARTMMLAAAVLLGLFPVGADARQHVHEIGPDSLVWDSPGLNSLGSMPLGNGDIGINVWVEADGDLVFYVAKTDAWSENGRLLKLGRVRLSLTPGLYKAGSLFTQTLDLLDGEIRIRSVTDGGETACRIRVDAHHPSIDIDVESPRPVMATATLEVWRRGRRTITREDESHSAYGLHGEGGKPIVVEPDSLVRGQHDRLVWLHRNERSIWSENLRLQGLEKWTENHRDPLLYRTFGGLIEGNGFVSISDSSLSTPAPRTSIHLTVIALTTQSSLPDYWLSRISEKADSVRSLSPASMREAHQEWWHAFWNRSYISLSASDSVGRGQADAITRGYALQRFITACSGRGASPIKFNGSLFTVDTEDRTDESGGLDADYRRWGGPYWFQNTRLPYWSMLCAGDLGMMTPLFRMFTDALPLRKDATQRYYGHAGAFFPETMYFWGTYVDANYGRDRADLREGTTENRYIRYYWTGGLELSLMMLEAFSFTGQSSFARDTLVPFATEILRFFDRHWLRDVGGKIRFEPSQALETYQIAVNPLPDIAGVRIVAGEMLALPDSLTSPALRAEWGHLLDNLPDLPYRVVQGETVLAPAEEYGPAENIENPELYAIFPFRLYGIGKPSLDLARRTYTVRTQKLNHGWQQNAIQAAYLGLAEEAASLVADNFMTSDPQCRFPAFWGPNYDWTPDQDHGSVAMIALQRMLLQYDGTKILLLPAWPNQWDATFRLHAPFNTVITCTVRGGKIKQLDVVPDWRRRDVVVP